MDRGSSNDIAAAGTASAGQAALPAAAKPEAEEEKQKDTGGALECRRKSMSTSTSRMAEEETQSEFTGKLIKAFHCNWFMESSPGCSDIFVPHAICSSLPDTLKLGDVVTASVVKHTTGRCKWRATSLVAVPEKVSFSLVHRSVELKDMELPRMSF